MELVVLVLAKLRVLCVLRLCVLRLCVMSLWVLWVPARRLAILRSPVARAQFIYSRHRSWGPILPLKVGVAKAVWWATSERRFDFG